MKKFTSTAVAAAQNPRTVARVILAFVASVLVVLLGLMAMSSGPNGATVFAQATESPSESPAPTGPEIKLLNPSQAYDPGLLAPPRPPGTPDPPKISDKYDGVDRLYHVVAVTRNAPDNAAVEAYFQPDVGFGLEMTVGILTRVPGQPDTWEMFWDIPDTMISTPGTFKVIMFAPTITGFEEVASDETAARVNNADETAEISWPTQGGQLGFHKPKGGQWRTVVEGTASADSNRVAVLISTTPVGEDQTYTRCAYVNISAAANSKKDFAADCALPGKALPSEVTSVAVVAVEDDTPSPATNANAFTQDSADAHRVHGYVQDVQRMTIEVKGMPGANGETTSNHYPTNRRRTAMRPFSQSETTPTNCLKFRILVKDHLGRPVQGANVDGHMSGPNDQAGFGEDTYNDYDSEDSAYKAPDKAGHSKEGARFCDDFVDTPEDDRGTDIGPESQGEHNVPGGADLKHIETTHGTGLDVRNGTAPPFLFGPGESRFFLFSFQPGFTDLTVWVDDEPVANEAAVREADDDLPEPTEPKADIRAQWLGQPATLSFTPRTDSAPVGECNKYTIRARSGNTPLPNVNIDVHASGPNNDLDFCDPEGGGSPRRAPDQPSGDTAHQHEDDHESSHKSSSPDVPEVQHTEGETDDDGNFTIGITSTGTGSTQLTAWIDGEVGEDNDVQDSGEVSATASKSWAASANDAQIRFVNPSGYGGSGDKISKKRDADEAFHLVARVDLPDVIPGVEFLIAGSNGTFTKIGDGVRVGDSDTWEMKWDVNVPDGTYTLRAQVAGTDRREDRSVTVRNNADPNDPRVVPFETAELTRPLNAGAASFDNNATQLEGVASAGAKGVEFYYTTTAASESRGSAQWIRCGGVTLAGGSAPQNFQGACTIPSTSTDVALDVTGLAVLAYICDPTGCTTQQGQEVGRIKHSGDAHRVFGFEASPNIFLEPSEAADQTGTCKRFEARVVDRAGRAIPNANVDVHLTGPGEGASFCDVEGGSERRQPDRGGHAASPTNQNEGIHQQEGDDVIHTEGETNDGGRFVFGIQSANPGDSDLLAWVDQDDNDELGSAEKSATGVMHWTKGGGGDPGKCTVKGDSGDNVLRGTPGDDVICGLGGHDTLIGRGGHDLIRGGSGRDILRGGGGRDLLRGGSGPDRLRGNSGNDRMYGNAGNDFINGGTGRDACRGGTGRDTVRSCER